MYELIVQKEYAWNLKSVYIRWMKRLRTHYYRNKHFSQLFQVLFYFKILSSLYMWMYSKCIQHCLMFCSNKERCHDGGVVEEASGDVDAH